MHKQNKERRPIAVVIALAILVSIAMLVYYMILQSNLQQADPYPFGMSSYPHTGEYEINPKTILASLEEGKTKVFFPMVTVSNPKNTQSPVGLYPWKQSDYLRVASSLHQFVWREGLEDWHLYGMRFFRGCHDNPNGFDSGEVTYFKTTNGPFSYTTHVIDIYPGGRVVSWGGDANFPRPFFGWQSIDTQKLGVNADGALQIAEENGGSVFRLSVNNMCTIDAFINPNPDHDDDWIIYYDNVGYSVFEIHVDPYTGEYKIFH